LDLHHPFTGPLERLGLSRSDPDWFAAVLAHPDTRFAALHELRVLIAAGGEPSPRLLLRSELPADLSRAHSITLLGLHGDRVCVGVDLDDARELELHGAFADLREIGGRLRPDEAGLLAQARAMAHWHARHRHCGSCGAPTLPEQAGHLRRCTVCATDQFPRVDPAVIVLVADEDRCLLGRQRRWETPTYSTLAGFVEPGETLEQAVAREVREESAVEVSDVHYLASQPWPFPASLMLAFRARPASYDIELMDGELIDARWFSRTALIAGIRSGTLNISRRHSIAWALIADWFDAGDAGPLAEVVREA